MKQYCIHCGQILSDKEPCPEELQNRPKEYYYGQVKIKMNRVSGIDYFHSLIKPESADIKRSKCKPCQG